MELHVKDRAMARMILLLALLAALAGCETTPTIVSQVQSYSALPGNYAAHSIAVQPFDEAIRDSLEFKTLKLELEDRLRRVGFTVVEPDADPRYVAYFGYGVDQGRDVQESYVIPHYGVTGYSSAHTTTTVGKQGQNRTITSTTTYTPDYGVTGYSTGVTSATLYTRSLAVAIADVEDQEEVWSMKVVSQGRCGIIRPVLAPMLDAAFSGFPETNGRVSIEVPELQC